MKSNKYKTMNLIDELNNVEQQIHTLNLAQRAYPTTGELITFQLWDPKRIYEYTVSDEVLDLYLDSLILHQTTFDDWKCKVMIKDETIFEIGISKQCFDKIKKVLDASEDIR